jgi:hypothetical protein
MDNPPPLPGRFPNGGVHFTPNALGLADRPISGDWRKRFPQRLPQRRPLGLELRAELGSDAGRLRFAVSIGRPARAGISASCGRSAAGLTLKAGAAL